jgi:hypothetical protein
MELEALHAAAFPSYLPFQAGRHELAPKRAQEWRKTTANRAKTTPKTALKSHV